MGRKCPQSYSVSDSPDGFVVQSVCQLGAEFLYHHQNDDPKRESVEGVPDYFLPGGHGGRAEDDQ